MNKRAYGAIVVVVIWGLIVRVSGRDVCAVPRRTGQLNRRMFRVTKAMHVPKRSDELKGQRKQRQPRAETKLRSEPLHSAILTPNGDHAQKNSYIAAIRALSIRSEVLQKLNAKGLQ